MRHIQQQFITLTMAGLILGLGVSLSARAEVNDDKQSGSVGGTQQSKSAPNPYCAEIVPDVPKWPDMAPTWKLKDARDNVWSSDQFRGKPLVLIFYQGAACLHCAEQLQSFAKMAPVFRKSGIAVVAVSVDDPKSMRAALRSVDGTFPIPLLSNAKLGVFKAFGVYDKKRRRPLHATFVIDKQGQIRFADIGDDPFHRPVFLHAEMGRLLSAPKNFGLDRKTLVTAGLGSNVALFQPNAVKCQPLPRVNLKRMPPRLRQRVAQAIWNYIGEDMIQFHMRNPQAHQQGNGPAFLNMHRAMIRHLENYLWARGLPLPYWYPGDPIPPEFMRVKQGGRIPRPPLRNPVQRLPAPRGLQPRPLLRFRSVRELGNGIMPWHDQVHQAVGGTMANTAISPSAVIFWPWHAFVDNMYVHWEQNRLRIRR